MTAVKGEALLIRKEMREHPWDNGLLITAETNQCNIFIINRRSMHWSMTGFWFELMWTATKYVAIWNYLGTNWTMLISMKILMDWRLPSLKSTCHHVGNSCDYIILNQDQTWKLKVLSYAWSKPHLNNTKHFVRNSNIPYLQWWYATSIPMMISAIVT